MNKAPGDIFYGLHFSEGVAEYAEPDNTYRIFINESVAKQMDSTFPGRPVFVDHVEGVDHKTVKEDADGWVVESFFNKSDGRHWVKFIVVTEQARQAIQKGWRLSNAYLPKTFGLGGMWHGVEYQKEVLSGEYEHLAIVQNPRYDESIILSPEDFKKYNSQKESELLKLANSKGETVKLNFFKRTKVENEIDLAGMLVTLPESKVEISLEKLVNEYDKVVNMHGYANDDHMVKVGEEEMSVSALRDSYSKKMNDEKEAKAKAEEEAKKNAEKKPEEEVKENKEEEVKEEVKEEKKENNLQKLKEAPEKAKKQNVLDLDKLARGKARYGSN